MTGEPLRLDKWLWYARFCKSRGMAADLTASGRIRCNGTIVTKAHFVVATNDVLTFPLGRHIRVVRVAALGDRRGPAAEARALYEDLAPPAAETALPPARGGNTLTKALTLLAVLGLGLALAPQGAAARAIAPDSWFQRDFDANYKLCAVRSNRPLWCGAWIDAVEAVRPKTDDISLPEWLRVPFGNYVLTCSTLLPPTWCPDWYEAMKTLTTLPEYTEPAGVLATQRIREEDAKAAAAQAWKDVLTRVVLNKVKPDDIELIKVHAKAGEVTALELLGWIYYDGRGVLKDYGLAYEYYGRAVLAGREDLRPILEKIWGLLNETQKLEINQIFK